MKETITYFQKPGKENTDEVLSLVKERAKARGVSKIVLASTTGYTAKKAMELFADDEIQLIVIPHQFGFDKPESKFPKDLAPTLEEKGHKVHFGAMPFHTDAFYGNGTPTALANILRSFCQGIKVCFEISFMAADGGCLAEEGEKIIAVAGTGAGADTAIIATSSTTQAPRGFKVHEIICMPS